MILLMIGASGGGKSYETVVYHILPALKNGRMVVTNMPLVVDEICNIEPSYRGLIVLRDTSLDPRAKWPFASVMDYQDDWKHPDEGYGPLYVVDEAQEVLPRGGTSREVDEWYARHRHSLCDVLLVTQSLGKISKAVTDNSQIVYRVRKAVALGKKNTYIRKVQDGPRGEVVDTSEREYMPHYFKYYVSHTQARGGMEAMAFDIAPEYKRWYRYSAITIAIAFLIPATRVFFSDDDVTEQTESARTEEHAVSLPLSTARQNSYRSDTGYQESTNELEPAEEEKPSRDEGPFSHLGLHVLGVVTTETNRSFYMFALSQNGMPLRHLTSKELELSGYVVEPQGPCAAKVKYNDSWRYASCDLATQGIRGRIATPRNSVKVASSHISTR